MRRLILAPLALLMGSCCSEGMIQREAIAPSVRALVERHDNYLRADTEIDPVERTVLLNESELLLSLISSTADEE